MQQITCGFIGLGDQGAPIAERMISAGYRTILWARRSDSLIPFQATPAVTANSVRALGIAVDYVGICVRGDDNVRAICRDLLPVMRAGSTIAMHSTTHPETCRKLAADGAERGITVVDAPVSGGRPAAQAGKLTVMFGGSEAALQQVLPIFETFAALVVHLGEVGSGQIAKLINNALLAANLGAVHMAVQSGLELGLDRDALMTLLSNSSGQSFALDSYSRQSDLGAFIGRLRLFDQIDVLEALLGREDNHVRTLRHTAECFFADPALKGTIARAAS